MAGDGAAPGGGLVSARLLEGLSLEERRLEVDGIATVVLEGGQGPPLLLLHGGIECGGTYWAPVVSRLAETNRLVVPDLPGLGKSDPVERLDPAVFAGWLAALLRLTCPEPPTLVAHSLAGSLAARFAARYGALLGRLVLYGTPAVGPYRLPLGLLATAIRFDLRPSDANMERFDRWAFFDLDRLRQRDPGWFAAFDAYNRSRAAVPHVKRTMRYLIATCTKRVPDDELAHIEVPTALLWGRHDRFVPLALAEGAAARLGWPLEVLDAAGHVPHIERPGSFLHALAAAAHPPAPAP